MAREMYLVGVTEEELRPDPKPEKPKTPRAKWENFWYHYKWATIGAVFAVVVLAVLIAQMVSRNDPDYTMLLVTEKPSSTDMLAYTEKKLAAYGEDIDGDGTVEVSIIQCYLGNANGNVQQQMTNSQVLQVHLAAGDVMLFAFTPKEYEWFTANALGGDGNAEQFFAPLDTKAPGLTEDGAVWSWAGDSRVTGDAFLSQMPKELYFGVRRATGLAAKNGEMQQQCLKLLLALAEDRPVPPPQDK